MEGIIGILGAGLSSGQELGGIYNFKSLYIAISFIQGCHLYQLLTNDNWYSIIKYGST